VTGRHAVVVGGGIVGLAVAHELLGRGWRITVLEKEDRWAAHQTGRNSNVVHSGLYYRPGSLKADLCHRGRASMVQFAREHGVPVQVCGKLVVATRPDEVPRLRALYERGLANGVRVELLDAGQAREYEPEAAAVAAVRVADTAITDYPAVCAALVRLLTDGGADLRTGSAVTGIAPATTGVVVETGTATIRADLLVNCAGLHSDRLARLAGRRPAVRIVPFRGEYYELRPDRRHLVRGLIYPVPDPDLPFLGVHLTRMIDGSVHAGPNAVLALRREGYRWRDVSPLDLAATLAFPGFRRMARRYARTGWAEVTRSLSRHRFAAALARLVPAVTADDIVPAQAGVRAQAVTDRGTLVDDFLLETAPNQIHVLNAPSPAATSALEIAKVVAAQAPQLTPGHR
jgi:L-2-hydroxyglutarate oxidase